MNREPAVIIAAIGATIALLVAFGVNLTEDQTKALMVFTIAIIALFTRNKVTPA